MPFFLSHIFLFFSFAALIPVALHLLHRQKPRPVYFAAMQFLQEAVASTRRARRLTQCLALLFRMLLLLLLALAFARPLVHWEKLLPKGSRTLILVLDSSAGMQALDGSISRFEIARAAALEVLRGADSDDRIALLAPGSARPDVIFPPVSMQHRVREELQKLEPGWGRAELFSFLHERLRQEQENLRGAEIYIFSDFQKNDCALTSGGQLQAALKKGKNFLYLNMTGKAMTGGNCGLQEVQFMPPAILGDGAFKVRVKAVGNAAFQGSAVTRLHVGDREVSQRVLTASASEPGVQLGELEAPPAVYGQGNVPGRLELDPDVFLPDNIHYFCLPHLQGQRAVMVYGEAPRDCFYLDKAVAPGGNTTSLLKAELVSWKDFLAGDFTDCAFIFLCNPPELTGPVQEKLKYCLQKRGTVLIFPGEALPARNGMLPVMDYWPGLSASVFSYASDEKLKIVENDRRELLVRSIARSLPEPGTVLVRRRLKLQAGPGQPVPWIWEDGGAFALPAPLERGQLWLFSVSANRDWSSWPVTPFFLILTQELIRKSAEQAAQLYQGEIGIPFRFSWPSAELNLNLELLNPQGRRRHLQCTRRNPEDYFWLSPVHQPGIYQLQDNGGKSLRFAVNIAASEKYPESAEKGDLMGLFPDIPAEYSADSGELQMQIARRRDGRPLWPVLLLAAWLLAIAEVLFANIRSARISRTQPDRRNRQ